MHGRMLYLVTEQMDRLGTTARDTGLAVRALNLPRPVPAAVARQSGAGVLRSMPRTLPAFNEPAEVFPLPVELRWRS